MGRRLRMTAELGDWLTELGDSEPAAVAVVAGALVAVLEYADPPALAIVGDPSATSPDPRDTADDLYRQMLEELQHVRRTVADVATPRQRAEKRFAERRAAGAEAAELAELERDLAAVRLREAELTEHSQRIQQRVDAFRTTKESAKALYTAAEARLRIAEALGATDAEPEDDIAELSADLRRAEERLRSLVPRAAPDAAPGLLELRADPLGSDIRILFAVEPADTVTLLAALEDAEAVREHGAEAVRLASDLLTEVREEGWPADVPEVTFENSSAFLARFFPPATATKSLPRLG